ncbi:hypothetical protein ACFVJH_32420 [Streptomyces decoyicus]|uniref:hypothetical protein n=1 Tax=Streptomyces decoyicus TaxID=249567 RepID=UPI00362B4B8E
MQARSTSEDREGYGHGHGYGALSGSNQARASSGAAALGERPRLRQSLPYDKLLQPRTALRIRPGRQLLASR